MSTILLEALAHARTVASTNRCGATNALAAVARMRRRHTRGDEVEFVRPEEPALFPPAAMTQDTTVIRGPAYGEGTYVASASSTSSASSASSACGESSACGSCGESSACGSCGESSACGACGASSAWGAVACAYKGFNKNPTYGQWWESAPGGYAGRSGPQKNGAYSGNVVTVVDGQPVGGEWLQLQLPGHVVLASYSISPRQDGSYPLQQRNPGSWVLAGSADGSTWTRLSTVTGHQWTDYDTLTLDLSAVSSPPPPPSFCFRLIVVNVGNWGTGDHPGVSVNELYLTGR